MILRNKKPHSKVGFLLLFFSFFKVPVFNILMFYALPYEDSEFVSLYYWITREEAQRLLFSNFGRPLLIDIYSLTDSESLKSWSGKRQLLQNSLSLSIFTFDDSLFDSELNYSIIAYFGC